MGGEYETQYEGVHGDDVDRYFAKIHLYQGSSKPSSGRKHLASDVQRHHAQRSERALFTSVRTRADGAKASIKMVSTTANITSQTLRDGWPEPTDGNQLVRSPAMIMANLCWDPEYVFVLGEGMQLTDSIVADIVGEAVAPHLASKIAMAASESIGRVQLTHLVDLFCCGGGVSLGFISALPSLLHVEGMDINKEGYKAGPNKDGRWVAPSLPSFEHNVRRMLQERNGFTVNAIGMAVPDTFAELCKHLGCTPSQGSHVHASPSCEHLTVQ